MSNDIEALHAKLVASFEETMQKNLDAHVDAVKSSIASEINLLH